jgi:hypothetical protein
MPAHQSHGRSHSDDRLHRSLLWVPQALATDDDDPTGALPEICQKLRYTQPRATHAPNARQRLSSARLCGRVQSCTAS